MMSSTQRRTLPCPIRSWICLSTSSASATDRPRHRRQSSARSCRRTGPGQWPGRTPPTDPRRSSSPRSRPASHRQASCAACAFGEPRAIPAASRTESAPWPAVSSRTRSTTASTYSSTSTPRSLDRFKPLGHQLDADHAMTAVQRDPRRHVSGRTEADDDHGAAVRHSGVLDCPPSGRQYVGQEHERSSAAPAGTTIGPYCACGTRKYSARPPGTCPYSSV